MDVCTRKRQRGENIRKARGPGITLSGRPPEFCQILCVLFHFIYIFLEGYPSAMLVFKGPSFKKKNNIYIQLKYNDYNATKNNGKNITKVIFIPYKKKQMVLCEHGF